MLLTCIHSRLNPEEILTIYPLQPSSFPSHELRGLLGVVFFSQQTTLTGALLPTGSSWHLYHEKDSGCSFVHPSASPAAGTFYWLSISAQLWGVLTSHPPVLGIGLPQNSHLSPENQGDSAAKAETKASTFILEEHHCTSFQEGSAPSSARSWHRGRKANDTRCEIP